jgi:predicted transcriptional regulator
VPTLDGDVLAVLAAHDVTFTTGQIHRVLDRFSEEDIRKVLSRLVVQGVVTAERVGNAFAYRLNSNHLAAEAILALAQLRNTFLVRLEAHFERWQAPPAYAAVFGSMAMDSMTAGSDIDLFLVAQDDTPEELWTPQIGELARTVTGWTGNDARPIVYTASDLRAARQEPVVREVVDHGLTVAGTRAWLLGQVGSRLESERSR